jgi:hypothetical protein
MAFIHEGGCECAKSELDLFSIRATQTGVDSGMYVDYHPVSSITGGAPIEFDVNATGMEYLDLTNSLLHVRAKIVKTNGEDLEAASTVGPLNNFLHSLFSQVDESLNGTLITNSTNIYAYRAYIETLLSYGSDAKSSQLTSALFYKDEAGKTDKPNPLAADDADKHSGLVKRQTFAATSSEINKIGRVHSDIFFQERYMLNEVSVRIKLIRSNDAFCLMSTGATQFQGRRYVCVVADSQSQNQSVGLHGARKNPGERYGQISNQTRHM